MVSAGEWHASPPEDDRAYSWLVVIALHLAYDHLTHGLITFAHSVPSRCLYTPSTRNSEDSARVILQARIDHHISESAAGSRFPSPGIVNTAWGSERLAPPQHITGHF